MLPTLSLHRPVDVRVDAGGDLLREPMESSRGTWQMKL